MMITALRKFFALCVPSRLPDTAPDHTPPEVQSLVTELGDHVQRLEDRLAEMRETGRRKMNLCASRPLKHSHRSAPNVAGLSSRPLFRQRRTLAFPVLPGDINQLQRSRAEGRII